MMFIGNTIYLLLLFLFMMQSFLALFSFFCCMPWLEQYFFDVFLLENENRQLS